MADNSIKDRMNLLKCISMCFKSTVDQETPTLNPNSDSYIKETQAIYQRSDIWDLTDRVNISFEVKYKDQDPETPRFKLERVSQSTMSPKLSINSLTKSHKKRSKKFSKSSDSTMPN